MSRPVLTRRPHHRIPVRFEGSATGAGRRESCVMDDRPPHSPASLADAAHGAPPADPLFALTSGLWASQALVAAEAVGLFTFLSREGGASAAETAEGLGIPARPADMLLTACASLDLLRRNGERYVNSPVAEEYLVR